MDQQTNEVIFATIDRLFDDNKPKEAEKYMLEELELARKERNAQIELTLLNELIGYYRQTSEKEPLRAVIEQAVSLSSEMHLNGTIPYATTLLNAANAFRSMNEYDSAGEYYEIAERIYNNKILTGELAEEDMLLAGLYNNRSLLFQELSDYKRAMEYQQKALMIATKNDAGFEIAATYANLANTCLLAKDYGQAFEYAQKAIALFEARNLRDPHYCAALSAMGSCYFEWGNVTKAKQIFTRALQIVEETIGRNSQYERLLTSIQMCEERGTVMSGLELARKYYEEYGRTMIEQKFPEYVDKIAVGLVGEGSDCFGFDDELSTDHDFGPDFCMWLSDETYEQIGQRLKEEYDKLPTEYLGIKRQTTAMGSGRRGVMRISDFYRKHLGTDRYEEIDFEQLPDYEAAVCTNGAIFCDAEGIFSALRAKLSSGYPADVRLRRLSSDVAGFTQYGQYNYSRMAKRQDFLTAELMLHDAMKYALRLYHHICNVYPPHDKWLVKSTERLPEGRAVLNFVKEISDSHRVFMNALASGRKIADKGENPDQAADRNQAADPREAFECTVGKLEELATYFATRLYECCDISDTDNYLDHHISELLFKAGVIMLDHKTIVDRIARLEFEAFDKVKNEGGRASCQNDWLTFSAMRKSQYLTWNHDMLVQYLYDFTREYEKGHNLITEKYGRMMESTAPDKYDEIKDNFPVLSEEKKAVIEQIVGIQMQMVEQFAAQYPGVAGNARTLHTAEDNMFDTSYETYLRGEISTYSDKMLQLYGRYVVQIAQTGGNIAYMTIENTAKLYGYQSIEDLEKNM